VDFSPILDGIRYVRSQVRLRSAIFVKAGNLIIGPGWVLFTVMGQNEFAVRWHGLDPARGAFLGMSILLGARGVGALFGPLLTAPWAGHWIRRLEIAIFWGFLAAAAGYMLLGVAGHLWQASLCVALAHFGSSIVWVFSTTLLQLQSEDKFRGRVFADLGPSMFTTPPAYLAGRFVDAGCRPECGQRRGMLMLVRQCSGVSHGGVLKRPLARQPRSRNLANNLAMSSFQRHALRPKFHVIHHTGRRGRKQTCRPSDLKFVLRSQPVAHPAPLNKHPAILTHFKSTFSPCRLSLWSRFLQPVNLGRQNEIRLRQPVHGVRPGRDFNLTPSQHDIGMMPLLLRYLSDAVNESQRRPKIRKLVGAHEVVLVNNAPLGRLW
jgi:hypothetical protein